MSRLVMKLSWVAFALLLLATISQVFNPPWFVGTTIDKGLYFALLYGSTAITFLVALWSTWRVKSAPAAAPAAPKPSGITPAHIVTTAVLSAFLTVLSAFAVIASPVAPGVALLYPAVAFGVAFGYWYGLWAAIAAYIGCVLGAGIIGSVPLHVNIYWSICDLLQVLIPAVAWRVFRFDPSLPQRRRGPLLLIVDAIAIGALIGLLLLPQPPEFTLSALIPWFVKYALPLMAIPTLAIIVVSLWMGGRDWLIFILFGIILNNIAGALWGSITLGWPIAIVTPLEKCVFFVAPTWFIGNVIVCSIIVPPLLKYLTPYAKQTSAYCEGLLY